MATISGFQPNSGEHVFRNASEACSQSPKLETIGRMVSGVAHDFANLLTLIAGYSDLLLERTGIHDPRRDDICEIRKAAERGAQLTSRLLDFSRRQAAEPKPLDINALVRDVERMLAPILGEHLEVSDRLKPGLDPVVADCGGIEQVLMNLMLNARDAMPGGGRIRIETSTAMVGPEEAAELGMTAGPCVILSVADTGHGIGPQAAGQIFQPFFTTKKSGEGTGLGLSIVLRVVQECGGAICVQSRPGDGATFNVYLPASRQPAERAEPSSRPFAARGTETILLVEDEEAVRHIMVLMLRQSGYRILEATDGEEGLQLFHQRESEIHLLLTDVVMPRMNGFDLALQVHSRCPGLPIICMSGYTEEVAKHTDTLDPAILFLEKPLRMGALSAAVREALDSASRPFNPR